MKILLVTGSINQGGAEFQLLSLARLLQSRGLEVEVLALTDYHYFKPYIRQHGLRYSCIPNKGSNLLRLWKAIRAIRSKKPDLVISYIKRVSQVAILARIYAGFSFRLITSERTSLIRPRHDLFYFNLTRLADFMTVNSLTKLAYIQKRFPFLKRKLVFMPNIIDTRRFFSVQHQPSADGYTRLTYVGRISPEKNLLNLVKAVGKLSDQGYRLRLSLHGAGNHKAYLTEVQQLIQSLGLQETVTYAGPADRVEHIYAQTDLLCLVSIFEGFSNVLSEAICSGLPVLASDIGENRFLVEDAVNGFLVEPGDTQAIADGIERFLQLTNGEREKISAANRQKAETIFDEEKIFQQYLVLFRKTGVIPEPAAGIQTSSSL